MDQTVKRPEADEASAIKASLNLDAPGAARQRRRGWLYAVLAVLVIAAAFGDWRWYAGAPVRIDYATQHAARADLTVQVSATGTLQPLTQVDISSDLSGIVRSVTVEGNQQVKKGDIAPTFAARKDPFIPDLWESFLSVAALHGRWRGPKPNRQLPGDYRTDPNG